MHTCVSETHHQTDKVDFRIRESFSYLIPLDGVAAHAHVRLAQAFHRDALLVSAQEESIHGRLRKQEKAETIDDSHRTGHDVEVLPAL